MPRKGETMPPEQREKIRLKALARSTPEKRCPACQEVKPRTEFHRGGGGRSHSTCKPCAALRSHRWRQENAEAVRLADRRRRLLRTFGLTVTQYDELLAAQNGRCKICERLPEETKRPVLDVDHCHTCGEVRALLCNSCNAALGMLRDDLALVEKAAMYLRAHGLVVQ